MKATFTINVEISTEELIALGEKWAEMNEQTSKNKHTSPDPPPPPESWVGKKVRIKSPLILAEEFAFFEKGKTYTVSMDFGNAVFLNKVSYKIEKDKLDLV